MCTQKYSFFAIYTNSLAEYGAVLNFFIDYFSVCGQMNAYICVEFSLSNYLHEKNAHPLG